jgi:hypothetical protein
MTNTNKDQHGEYENLEPAARAHRFTYRKLENILDGVMVVIVSLHAQADGS